MNTNTLSEHYCGFMEMFEEITEAVENNMGICFDLQEACDTMDRLEKLRMAVKPI